MIITFSWTKTNCNNITMPLSSSDFQPHTMLKPHNIIIDFVVNGVLTKIFNPLIKNLIKPVERVKKVETLKIVEPYSNVVCVF